MPRRSLFIDGQEVFAFEFPTTNALQQVRSGISADGYSIPLRNGRTAMVDWISPPHFYSAGRLITLYLGDKKPTLLALASLLGQQFAGS